MGLTQQEGKSTTVDATIQCDIVSSGKEFFSGEVTLFTAIGVSGELGIMARHAPLITTLKPGPVRLRLPGGEEVDFIISGGILEVMPHLISVLADSAERASHLDAAAAMEARREAERTLRTARHHMDLVQAEAKLALALAELRELDRMRREGRRGRTPKSL